jgi:hypothetical protein
MGNIIKIVLALALLTAAFNASRAALNNYQFEDAVQQGMLFDPRASDAEVEAMVMKLAGEYQIPLTPENIDVKLLGKSDVVVSMSYTDTVVLLPGIFEREWTFNPTATARILTGNRR